jgi:hypothetical protein
VTSRKYTGILRGRFGNFFPNSQLEFPAGADALLDFRFHGTCNQPTRGQSTADFLIKKERKKLTHLRKRIA